MITKTIKERNEMLEAFVDQYGMANVLRALRDIADGKAEHIRANWQDVSLARDWERASVQLANCAERTSVAKISHG